MMIANIASLWVAAFVIGTYTERSTCVLETSKGRILTEWLATTYRNHGVVGVLDWFTGTNETSSSSACLVQTALDIPDKGIAAGVVNAMIASCCRCTRNNDAELALDLFSAYDKAEHFAPDIVTLAVTYTATFQKYPSVAKDILEQSKDLIANRVNTTVGSALDYPKTIIPTHPEIEVLLDREGFAIINKPSGIVVSHGKESTLTRRRNRSQSLEEVLMTASFDLSSLNPDGSRGFVHRLDRGTSGCLLIAKTNPWHARLMTQFFLRRVEKTYIALVYTNKNIISLPSEGHINLAIDGRPAQSSFLVLERYGTLAAKLQVKTLQGRKHQVRIHCSRGLKAPILLDPLYGGEAILYHLKNATQFRARQQFCLHANFLSIPDMDIPTTVQAPLPEWWDCILNEIASCQ